MNQNILIIAIPFLIAFGAKVALNKGPGISSDCLEQKYSTEILSLDPLIIYINNFVSDTEIDYVMKLGQVT